LFVPANVLILMSLFVLAEQGAHGVVMQDSGPYAQRSTSMGRRIPSAADHFDVEPSG